MLMEYPIPWQANTAVVGLSSAILPSIKEYIGIY
jgi:hypothetical protein